MDSLDTEELKKSLDKLIQLNIQNNRILRRMRREILIMRFVHLFYWIVIAVALIWGYIYIQPYVIDLMSKVQSVDFSQLHQQ